MPDVLDVAPHLRNDLGANLLVLSDDPVVRALGPTAIPTLTIAEPLASIAQIVAAQSFALHLAEAKGVDPERPRHLWKVTATR